MLTIRTAYITRINGFYSYFVLLATPQMKTFFISCLFLASSAVFAMPQDSIGVKTVAGQRYIMHKVSKGDGVYSLSRKYGVPASDIFAANEGSDKTIKLGQVLLIPKSVTGAKTAKANPGSSS